MPETLLIVLEQSLLHFPLILGAYISISLMKTPDLSLESAYVFGALLASMAIPYVQNMPSTIGILSLLCISLIGGACVGITSATLTQKARIPHLLSSIITTGIFHGINQLVAGTYVSLSKYTNLLSMISIPLHPELPALLIIFMILTMLAYYFFRTEHGYCVAVFGDNSSFFTYYGISTLYIFMSGIIIANSLAGLSGYLIAQSNGFADINMGFGKVLLCITTLILGKIIQTNTLSISAPIGGMLCYFLLQQMLLKVGFDLRYFTMIQAIIILLIMLTHYKETNSQENDHLGV